VREGRFEARTAKLCPIAGYPWSKPRCNDLSSLRDRHSSGEQLVGRAREWFRLPLLC
jgi:hypothetical protein